MNNTSLCAEEYYDNCLNALVKCKQCAAYGVKGAKLHYSPIDTTLTPHPYSKDTKKQQRLKQARAVEKSIIASVAKATLDSVAKATVRSGAANGDGDCILLNGTLRKEIKDRGPKASWCLTWAEFQKGVRQGIDIYAISVICPDQVRRTIYMLEETLYNELVSQLREGSSNELKPTSEEV